MGLSILRIFLKTQLCFHSISLFISCLQILKNFCCDFHLYFSVAYFAFNSSLSLISIFPCMMKLLLNSFSLFHIQTSSNSNTQPREPLCPHPLVLLCASHYEDQHDPFELFSFFHFFAWIMYKGRKVWELAQQIMLFTQSMQRTMALPWHTLIILFYFILAVQYHSVLGKFSICDGQLQIFQSAENSRYISVVKLRIF